ncbi:hypothetical protein [Pseudoroseomonas sp. WGS1072]|uniref:hypothetical protein n=1 Tax=Roseomonas sp. WGS1072 TaxID=3366816 RepID=UPI003BF37734
MAVLGLRHALKARLRRFRRPTIPAAPPVRPLDLAGRRVLLVYGLLGEGAARLAPLGMDYMGTQLRWLLAQGAVAQVVKLPTTAPIAPNAALLAEAILASPAPCLIVAHSKGGLEALAALLDPAVAARCTGLLALQSPFFGSPVADALLARPRLHRSLAALVRALRMGGGAGLPDLSTTGRAAWMREHAARVAEITAAMPVLCVAARLSAGISGPDRRYLPMVRWMERQGAGPNDGLVSVASALLPGAMHRVVTGGHRVSVSQGKGRDPIGILRQGLGLLLSRRMASPLRPDGPSPATPPPSAS